MVTKIVVTKNFQEICEAEKYGCESPPCEDGWADAWIDLGYVTSANRTVSVVDGVEVDLIRLNLSDGTFRLVPCDKYVIGKLYKRFRDEDDDN